MRIRDITEKQAKKPDKKKPTGSEIKLPKLRKGDQVWFSGDVTDHATITGQTKDPLTRQPMLKTSRGTKKVFNFNIPKNKITDAVEYHVTGLINYLAEARPNWTTTRLDIDDDDIQDVISGYRAWTPRRPKDPVQYPEDHQDIKNSMMVIDELTPDQRTYIHHYGAESFKLQWPQEWENAKRKAMQVSRVGVGESRRAPPAKAENLAPTSLLPLAKSCLAAAKSPYWKFTPSQAWIKAYEKLVKEHSKTDGFNASKSRMEMAERVRRQHDNLYKVKREAEVEIHDYQRVQQTQPHEPSLFVQDSYYMKAMSQQIRATAALEHFGEFNKSLRGMHLALGEVLALFEALNFAYSEKGYDPDFCQSLREYLEGFLPFCEFILGH